MTEMVPTLRVKNKQTKIRINTIWSGDLCRYRLRRLMLRSQKVSRARDRY